MEPAGYGIGDECDSIENDRCRLIPKDVACRPGQQESNRGISVSPQETMSIIASAPHVHYPAAMKEPVTCWAISDGAAGNERQALALARALGLQPRVMRIRLRQPWEALAPRLLAGAMQAIRDEHGAALAPPWPDLAIGCGRRAALVTRLLRARSDGRSWTVQILDPRIDSHAFDLVIAPAHDRVDGDNVIRSIGALNPVDHAWLADGRARFARFAALPSPRTTVLDGASNRAQRLDRAYFSSLLDRLEAWHAVDGGSFLVSVSRRTPGDVADGLRNAFAKMPGLFWAGAGDGENPYPGLLAWADRFVVTPDSVNMLSEACATGKPVYTYAPRAIGGKLAGFHAELAASGHLRRLGDATPHPQPTPLAETADIAELVRERWRAARR
jgi:mitochondrial fission protein ELM1